MTNSAIFPAISTKSRHEIECEGLRIAKPEFSEGKMIALLHIVAILFVIGGVLLILYTEKMGGAMRKLLSIRRVRWLAIIPFAFGAALIAGSFYSEQTFWLALILGLLAVIKGVYLVIGPLPQIKGLAEWWLNRASYRIFRLCGLVIFVLGIAILSSLF